MKSLYPLLFLPLLSIAFYSCEEVEQKELDKEKVKIIAPTNELVTTNISHTFLWQAVEHAEAYIFQIASPSFQEIQQLIVHEDLEELTYEFTLSPGSYEWRVKAYNNISETPFTTYQLTIDSSLNLNNAQLVLKSPSNNYMTMSDVLTLSWDPIGIADAYVLEVRTPDWEGGSLVFNPVYTTSSSYTNTDDPLEEGVYAWAVYAENTFSKSAFSPPRYFTVDFTAPSTPVLSKPADNAMLGDSSFTFIWSRPVDNGSEVYDSLYIYSDAAQTNLIKGISTETTFYEDSLGVGSYYWRVRSIDAAGNKSNSSDLWSFTIN